MKLTLINQPAIVVEFDQEADEIIFAYPSELQQAEESVGISAALWPSIVDSVARHLRKRAKEEAVKDAPIRRERLSNGRKR